jgi:hypothetical protein
MFKLKTFKSETLTFVLIAVCVLMSLVPMMRAQSSELPPGPIEPKVQTACLECHGARIIVQQRLSKKGWTKEVDKMIKWGAVVEAADRDSFIDYLSLNFGTEKPADPESRVVTAKKN